jgi:phosphoglycolate phosphatase
MQPIPRLLVFDLDGTLIDSSLDLCNAVNAALTHVGRPALPNAVIAGFIGDGAAALIHRSLAHPEPWTLGLEPLFDTTYAHFLAFYREHKLDHTRCYPGVLHALTAIRTRHPRLPMAVLTNKPVNPSREICAALGLAPFFFQNYGGNSFPTKKPDPAGLRTIIAETEALLGAPQAWAVRMSTSESPIMVTSLGSIGCTMIGDSDVDIRTAHACGARSIGCTFGLAPQSLAAAKPSATVDSPSEWPGVLGL